MKLLPLFLLITSCTYVEIQPFPGKYRLDTTRVEIAAENNCMRVLVIGKDFGPAYVYLNSLAASKPGSMLTISRSKQGLYLRYGDGGKLVLEGYLVRDKNN